MVKPEWGSKRTCPKCSTRFYDLGNDEPITCISCGVSWTADPVLKSKQPLPFEEEAKSEPALADADLHEDIDLEAADEGEPSPDDEVDLGGDEDLGVNTGEPHEEV